MRRARPSVIACCGLLGFAAVAGPPPAQPPQAPPDPPVLSGLVHGADGKPIAGATVRAMPAGLSVALRDRQVEEWIDPVVVATDERGAFVVRGIPGKAFTLRVEAPRHAPQTLRDVPSGAERSVKLTAGALVRGRTTELGGESPVAGATVRFCDQDAVLFGVAACGRVTSDERGEFVFDAAIDGTLYVRATAERRAASRTLRIDPAAGAIVLGLGPGAWVRGRVLDQRSVPVEGARISVIGGSGTRDLALAEIWAVLSDEEGRFVIEGLAAGERHALHAHRSDRPVAKTEPFLVEAGRDLEIPVRMPAAAVLLLGLIDPEGQRIQRFDVFLQEAGSPDDFGPLARAVPEAFITPDANGRFAIRALEGGRFDVLILPAGYAELRRNAVKLDPGASTDLGVLEVTHGRTIEGRVLDPEDAPIAGASIKVWDGAPLDSRAREARTDGEGRFEIAGLREGQITVYAEARGFFPRQVRLDEGAETADVTLSPAAGIAGRVETSDGEAPPAFTVFVHAEAAEATGPVGVVKQQSFAAGDGSWRIEDVGAGRYTVEARAEGWAPGRRRGVEVSGTDLMEIPTITLARGLILRGRVETTGDETPLAGATVAARRSAGWIPVAATDNAVTTTDDAGRFELAGLEPGALVLRATYPGLAPAEIEVELRPAVPVDDVRLRLSGGGRLTGTVRDRHGMPLGNRTLVLAEGADVLGISEGTAVTDSLGVYDFPHVVPGGHTLRLLPGPPDAFTVMTKTVAVGEGEVTVADFEPDSAIQLSGMVLRDQIPLPHAQLYLTPAGGISLSGVKFARADDSGRYEVALDAPGRYRIMVQIGATGGSSTEIDVPAEPEVVRDVTLESAGIGGTVSDDGGEPVPGAAVAARPEIEREPLGDALLIAETDEHGRYAIQGLAAGTYRVTAVAAGFRVGEIYPVEVDGSRANAPVDFRLERGRLLRGRIVDPQGRGVAGAYVFAAASVSPDPLNPASAETDVNGAFEMTAPADGPLDVSVFAAGWASALASGMFPSESDEADEVVLRVAAGGRLCVRVVDGAGQPVVGFHVLLRPVPAFVGSEIGRLLRPPPPTDSAGVALIELLSPGTWELGVAGRDDVAPLRVEIHEGAEQEALLRLP